MSPSKIISHSNVIKYREIIPDPESQSTPSLSPKFVSSFCSETTLQLTSTLMPTASSLSQSSIPSSLHYNNYTCTLCGKLLKTKTNFTNLID